MANRQIYQLTSRTPALTDVLPTQDNAGAAEAGSSTIQQIVNLTTASLASSGVGVINANGLSLYSTNPATSGFNTFHGIFFGYQAGYQAASASYSTFLGVYAGWKATYASQSYFIGGNAGYSASLAYNSNFIGYNAGNNAVSAYQSNFLGYRAGGNATNAYNSNFFGPSAGQYATNAYNSNFSGYSAGYLATNAYFSNFAGHGAGYGATNSSYSNFIGAYAGNGAVGATNSNFIGNSAGSYASSASYSTFIGYQAGANIGGTGSFSNNVIIGTNITLPDGTSNAMNLGGIIFASGSYSTTAGNPSSAPAMGKVGINVVTPTQELDVSGSVNVSKVLILPPQSPLPSGVPTGSLAASGSGATCKVYFFNGSWNALF